MNENNYNFKNPNIESEQKKSKNEMFIGSNLINKIGVIFVIIGAIAFSQLSPEYVPNIIKTILIFVLGAGMLLAGEIMNRKKADVFSHGITGGGTAILYAAIAAGYLSMHTINEILALILCFILTSAVFLLANRYNSQTILSLSLIGGFLPVFVLSSGGTYIYASMIYFLLLNTIALAISFTKKWSAATVVCFISNTIANFFVIFASYSLHESIFANNFISSVNPFILLIYIALSYMICAVIPLIGTIRSKSSITILDNTILILNAFVCTISLIVFFILNGWGGYITSLFIALAVVFCGFSAIIRIYFGNIAITKVFGTFSVFLALIFCSVQLRADYIPIGISVITLIMAIIAITMNLEYYKIFAIVMGSVNFFFVISTAINDSFWLNWLVYAILIAASALIAYKFGLKNDPFIKALKHISLINIWLYSIYLILSKFSLLARQTENPFIISYLIPCSAIVVTFIAAFIYGRLKNKLYQIASMILYGLAILFFFGLQLSSTPVSMNLNGGWYIFMIVVSISVNIMSVLAVYDLSKSFNAITNGKGKLLPVIISGYILISSTATLSAFDAATITNWLLSVIYILMAFAWIWFGFKKENVIMRRFGLGLSLLASAKLFFIDLTAQSEIYGTISWFAFGIVLIAISYLYKFFGKIITEKNENK